MKDIGAVLASLFVIFILISLLSVDDTQNSGLNSSLGKTSDSGAGLVEAVLLHRQQYRTNWRYRPVGLPRTNGAEGDQSYGSVRQIIQLDTVSLVLPIREKLTEFESRDPDQNDDKYD
jgi:hypothetical protein